jgi:chromosome segregation ATPase
MPAVNSMLGLFGLATRRQLESAVDRKDRWHGLVRNVFVPYYLKFQETALASMPELPNRYTSDWDSQIQAELEDFLTLDLESVGELLEAAGFGTEKWERLQETGFPALGRLLDQVAASDQEDVSSGIGADAIDAAVSEDVLALLSRHPDLAREVVSRIDFDTGTLQLTDDDVVANRTYQQVLADLETARTELRRFRRGGRRALDRIHQLEVEHLQGNGNGQPAAELKRPARDTTIDDDREKAVLRKDLRARDSMIAALRGKVEDLDQQLNERSDPEEDLEDRTGWLQRELESRDDQVVRLQTRIEALQDELDTEGSTPDESDEVRGLRDDLEKTQTGAQQVSAGAGGTDLELDADALQALRNDLKARDHTIESLREEVAKLEFDASRATARASRQPEAEPTQTPVVPKGDSGPGRQEEIDAIQRDLRAREATILSLRERLETFERELGQSREQLLEEVKKLAALAAGDVELKPSEELDAFDSNQLMDYAREVAEDLDVRRQTLEEGLQGVESVKGSYDHTKKIFEQQQRKMESQLEQLRSEVDLYRERKVADEDTPAGLKDTIVTQRSQLELLATRVRQLVSTNKELNESNKKMYENLEAAVKKVIPLHRRIEEQVNLQDALQKLIRQKYDRTFTMRQLDR